MTSRVTLSFTKTQTTSTSSPTVSTVSGLSRNSRNFTVSPAASRALPRCSRSYFLVSKTVTLVMDGTLAPGVFSMPSQQPPWPHGGAGGCRRVGAHLVCRAGHAPPGPDSPTARTTPSRHADRASYAIDSARAILADALVGHLGVLGPDGWPVVLPVAVAPDGDRVLMHGSTGSRMFRSLAGGAPACLTVTHIDGLVLARSAFESSMNYRSLVVLGTAEALDGAEKEVALRTLSDHLAPGRWDSLRPMRPKEVAATTVLGLPLSEFSVKSRAGGRPTPTMPTGRSGRGSCPSGWWPAPPPRARECRPAWTPPPAGIRPGGT